MKIEEAINKFDGLVHNTYGQSDKITWLSELDADVKKRIIDAHSGTESVAFSGYGESTSTDTELLVSPPFDAMYLLWLEAQVHYYNNEMKKYNNAVIRFNTVFEEYRKHYIASHVPLRRGERFLF